MSKKSISSIFVAVAIALTAVVMAACGKNRSFTADLTMKGLGTQDIIAMIVDTDGITELTVMGVDDSFTIEGAVDNPTVVELYSRSGSPLGSFIAVPGEKSQLEIEGGKLTSAGKSKANQAYIDFISRLPEDASPAEVNRLVATIVDTDAENIAVRPIFAHYFNVAADPEEAARILQIFEAQKEPLSIELEHVASQIEMAEAVAGKMPETVSLLTPADTIAEADFASAPLTVTFISSTIERGGDTLALPIEELLPERSSLIVIRTTLDTINWERNRGKYNGENVSHFWSPGGMEFSAGSLVAIADYPYWIVNDSTLQRLYSTASIDSITAFIKNYKK
ncbi:MAG: hypothetical protein K2M80_02445 [Muribaculaceae bacterium]|nr:hypothetical protein [Muribaculaceae bacterium]